MAPRRSGRNKGEKEQSYKGKQPAEENDQDVEMAVIQPEEPPQSHSEVFRSHYFNHDVTQNVGIFPFKQYRIDLPAESARSNSTMKLQIANFIFSHPKKSAKYAITAKSALSLRTPNTQSP